MTRDVPMFNVESPPPPQLSVMHSGEAKVVGKYTRYKPIRRTPCDECVAVLHEHNGVGSAPLGARWTRRGLKTLRLCGPHHDLWRDVDGTLAR